jgi:hypothetical protein
MTAWVERADCPGGRFDPSRDESKSIIGRFENRK